MTTLVSFHGQQAIKDKYLGRVRAHQAADALVQGYGYWKDGKGCTIHGSNHAAYETELGIPRALAKIEDGLFESLPVTEARAWLARFLEVIPVGVNLRPVVDQFMLYLLADETDGVIRFAQQEDTKAAIQTVIDLYRRKIAGEEIGWDIWADAAYAAARVRQSEKLLALLAAAV